MLLLRVGPLGLGPLELVIILLVLVMVFGASRLTDIGGSLGKGIKEFRREVSVDEDDAAGGDGEAPSASADGTVQAVKCGSCGSLNEASARHCNQCGAALGASIEQN
jgi:sec-independent protein translocase protein TatA